jgi:hypothetical protein
MKIKFAIPTPDDSGTTLHSSFLYKTTRRYNQVMFRTRLNTFGESIATVSRAGIGNRRRKGLDPLLENIKKKISECFLDSRRGYSENDRDWYSTFGWRYDKEDVLLTLIRDNGTFYLNGVKKNKDDVASALAKIVMFGTTNRSARALNKYITTNVMYPQNIIYALENRVPFYFYERDSDGIPRKVECRINMQQVDAKEVALEISDGIWGSLKVKDANILINSYRNNSARSKKWSNLSPRKLWMAVMNSEPSDSQLSLMIAWLKQNRTGDMVETRAKSLLIDMSRKYDDVFLLNGEKTLSWLKQSVMPGKMYDFSLLVRGKLGDWIVYANDSSSQYQRTSAVFLRGESSRDGPFCIDNLHDNSSIGDQIATRAMILRNDEKAKEMIHTLRRVDKTNYRLSQSILEGLLA